MNHSDDVNFETGLLFYIKIREKTEIISVSVNPEKYV